MWLSDVILAQNNHHIWEVFICSLSYKWENNIEKLLTCYCRLKAKLKFQIICFTLESLQNKLHCRQISEMLPEFLSSSVRLWWRAVLPVHSSNGVCGRHAARSSRLAGTCLERYTCHSPSYMHSSELQPWIISSRSKSLSFLFFFLTLSLQNQPPSPCNYFNTCSGESKDMEYSSTLFV